MPRDTGTHLSRALNVDDRADVTLKDRLVRRVLIGARRETGGCSAALTTLQLQPVDAREIEPLEDVARVGHADGGAAGIVTYDLDPAVVDASALRVPSGMRKSVG
jgi:hypothetical protein